MARDSEYCVLTLPLLTQPWQEHIIEKRFDIMENLINSLIAFELKKLKNLQRTKAYRMLEQQIEETPKENRKELYARRLKMLQEAGFTKFDFISDAAPMRKHFEEHLIRDSSNRAAEDVWRAFETLLFKKGKKVRFKKRGSLNSISNVRHGWGMLYHDGILEWKGGRCKNQINLSIQVAAPKTKYEEDMLKKECKYIRIVRKWVKTRYKYYMQLVLIGTPATKNRVVAPGRVGLIVGSHAIAVAAENEAWVKELSGGGTRTNQKIQRITDKMQASICNTNPEYLAEDGSIRKTRKPVRKRSNHYSKLEKTLAELTRKTTETRKQQHNCLANEILALGSDIYVVDISNDLPSKMIGHRAPSLFLSILEQKLKNYNRGPLHGIQSFELAEAYHTHVNELPMPTGEKEENVIQAARLIQQGNLETQEISEARRIRSAKPKEKQRKEYTRISWAEQYRNHGWSDLTDAQWERVAPLLPQNNQVGGRRSRVDDRQILNGILCNLNGTPWRNLPEQYGHWRTVFERFKRYGEDGTLERVFRVLQEDPQ